MSCVSLFFIVYLFNLVFFFFFFNDTATTEIYTLSLHDALPIFVSVRSSTSAQSDCAIDRSWLNSFERIYIAFEDRKSTRLNSSHLGISYAVFCLKKKKQNPHRSRSTTGVSSPV